MDWLEVTTQQELDEAIRLPDIIPVCVGDGTFEAEVDGIVRAVDRTHLRATGTGMVEVAGRASVEASGDLVAEAYHDASIAVAGSVTLTAIHRTKVTARDRARVLAWGPVTIDAGDEAFIELGGRGQVVARGRARVQAGGISRAEISGSVRATVFHAASVDARDSAVVRAWDRARVRAHDSAAVECFELARVVAAGESAVTAWGVGVVRTLDDASVTSADGVTVTTSGATDPDELRPPARLPWFTGASQWCDFYGVGASDGVAILYKAVRDDFRSRRGASYAPGSRPQAPDWDGGREECGGGLHLAARPFMSFQQDRAATRIVACPVRLDEMAIAERPTIANKVKARGVCAPVYEVDEEGEPLR